MTTSFRGVFLFYEGISTRTTDPQSFTVGVKGEDSSLRSECILPFNSGSVSHPFSVGRVWTLPPGQTLARPMCFPTRGFSGHPRTGPTPSGSRP